MVTLSDRHRKRLLLAANAVLLLAIVASVLGLSLAPLRVGPPPGPYVAPQSAEAGQTTRPSDLGAYAVIYSRDLRRPLYDPDPQPAEPPPEPKLGIHLVGAVVEPGFTYGMFRTKTGEQKLVRVGESVGGAKLVEVSEESARLQYKGRTITLSLEKKQWSR